METVDINALRDYLKDYCGTAMMNGFPAAFLDLVDIDSMNEEELRCKADYLGIDLERFVIKTTRSQL